MFFIADIYVALRNVTTLRNASTLRNVTRSTPYWAVESLSAQLRESNRFHWKD